MTTPSREAAGRSKAWTSHIDDHVMYLRRQLHYFDSLGFVTCRPCMAAQLANTDHRPCYAVDCWCECS